MFMTHMYFGHQFVILNMYLVCNSELIASFSQTGENAGLSCRGRLAVGRSVGRRPIGLPPAEQAADLTPRQASPCRHVAGRSVHYKPTRSQN
jgi:hypothetical protein